MVSARGVNGHTGRFVNDDQVIVFVDDADWGAGHGGFMAVGGMRDDLAVLDDGVSAGGFAIDADQAVIECRPL